MSFAERFFPNDVTAAIHGEGLFSRRGEGVSSSLFLYQLYRLVASIQTSRVDRARSDAFPRGVPRAPGLLFRLEDAIDWAIRQLEELPRPFFAYLHFLPPHDPYNARSEFVGRFDDGWSPIAKPDHPLGPGLPRRTLDDYRRQYDEFVAYVDAEFGRLVNELDGKGLLTSTNLFVTSDHGEMFERGIWEHITPVLFQPLIHIPLIASAPGQMSARRVDTATSCVDLLPTLLDIAGVERPAWLEGEILPTFGRSTAAGSTPTAKRVVYALEAKRNPKNAPLRTRTAAIVGGGHKLVHYRGYEGYDDAAELYDVEHDPEELNDLYASNPDLAREMRATLAAQLSAHDAVGES
jgi:arylsulfatase A-like enzyme